MSQICFHSKFYGKMTAVICSIATLVIYGNSNYENTELCTIDQIENHTKYEDFSSDIEYGVLKDVYYFWCEQNRMFEFRHYLSFRSVFLHLDPYRVRLLYEYEPIAQEVGPNTWLTELRQEHAFLSFAKLPEKWCANRQRNIEEHLSKHGGIYVQEDVILSGPLDQQWLKSVDSVRVVDDSGHNTLFQISKRGKSNVITTTSTASTGNMTFIVGSMRAADCRYKTLTVKPISSGNPLTDHTAIAEEDAVKLFKTEDLLFPEHIWELDSEEGRLLRTAAYGKPDIARPIPDYSRLAPNIAHIIWSNNDTMSFEFYLCVLSLLKVAKFDKVYIHGDGPPTGRFWGLIKNHPRLRLVRRTFIDGDKEHVYGNEVKVRAHVADVLRVDIMNRYGGLYVDTDAIFFRPLTRELRAYDAVVAPDIARNGYGFPNVYQNGVMLGKPGARLWRLYIESMKKYYDNDWLWNSNFGLYRVKERHPETVLNYPRLNTICFDSVCHPYWEPYMLNITNERTVEIMKEWKNNTFAIQNCGPQVAQEHSSPEALLKNNGTTLYGAVAMYVLEKANKLDFFRKVCMEGLSICWKT